MNPLTLLLLVNTLLRLGAFFNNAENPPAADTDPISEPYTPPFTGGQCAAQYSVSITAIVAGTRYYWTFGGDNQNRQSSPPNLPALTSSAAPVNGGISGVSFVGGSPSTGAFQVRILSSRGNSTVRQFIYSAAAGVAVPTDISIFQVYRRDGTADSCGNTPNPEASPNIPSTGFADSEPPDIRNDSDTLIQGLVPLNLAALLAAALEALKLATTIAEMVAALADAIAAIDAAIDKLKPENKDKNVSIIQYQFGSILRDGFLRFYPNEEVSGLDVIYLDILFTSIPNGIGKYFGKLSPNRYIYDSLGYIAFVSPSFGVMEVRQLEFPRQSFQVPEEAIGFFYHLGLNGTIRANASAIYRKEIPPVEE